MKETIKIEGMSCNNCVKHVTNALNGLEGVEVINVELGNGNVEIENNKVSKEVIAKAIDDIGYKLVD